VCDTAHNIIVSYITGKQLISFVTLLIN
jgi:hypothetical protein